MEAKDRQKSPNDDSTKKLTISVAVGLLALLAVVVLGVAVIGGAPTECEKFLAQYSAGKKITVLLDPVTRRECLETMCDFDYGQCASPCPFGFAQDEETECPNSCDCAESGSFQGDIQFNEDEIPKMMKDFGHSEEDEDFELFYAWGDNKWDNIEVDGRYKIPYILDEVITEDFYKEFDMSMRNLSQRTCLDFIPRTENEPDYLKIMSRGQGCSAHIGRAGGRQLVNLPEGCFFEATIQHELMHTLGFYHEQSRKDRDAYVDIHWDNLDKYTSHNFDKEESEQLIDLGSEYEITSGMHYMSFCWAVDKSKPTITGKGNVIIKKKHEENFLTAEDLHEIRLLYKCKDSGPNKKTGEWNEWNNWSECTQTCGDGKRQRYRHCIHQATGEKLVDGCPGLPSDYEECNTAECPPPDGEWKEWGSWASCSATCGPGRMMQSRECSKVLACVGEYFNYKPCYEVFCDTGEKVMTETFGTWTQWTNWMVCDKHCGKGKQTSTRTCARNEEYLPIKRCAIPDDVPNLSEHGNVRVRECELRACAGQPAGSGSTNSNNVVTTAAPGGAVGGSSNQWGEWSQWSTCDVTCGEGQWTRERTCPVSGSCVGASHSFQSCSMNPCGSSDYGYGDTSGSSESSETSATGWGDWGRWTQCDKTCGSGTRLKTRKCKSYFCEGSYKETESCQESQCSSGRDGKLYFSFLKCYLFYKPFNNNLLHSCRFVSKQEYQRYKKRMSLRKIIYWEIQ
uniref:zinc metalloproteinase nas-36-like n=1 Tax=Styela clava TaxID=7725 RepID=UPI001939C9F5|nr:zinc metalloproteinase nas-36-like [Styela clava]